MKRRYKFAEVVFIFGRKIKHVGESPALRVEYADAGALMVSGRSAVDRGECVEIQPPFGGQ